jgi:hypothetical protein
MAAVLANIELRYFVINSHCINNPYAKRVLRSGVLKKDILWQL